MQWICQLGDGDMFGIEDDLKTFKKEHTGYPYPNCVTLDGFNDQQSVLWEFNMSFDDLDEIKRKFSNKTEMSVDEFYGGSLPKRITDPKNCLSARQKADIRRTEQYEEKLRNPNSVPKDPFDTFEDIVDNDIRRRYSSEEADEIIEMRNQSRKQDAEAYKKAMEDWNKQTDNKINKQMSREEVNEKFKEFYKKRSNNA